MNTLNYFFNKSFNKKKLTKFILWYFNQYGENRTIQFIEKLKQFGFQYSTQAGVSISIEDLNIPIIKPQFIKNSETVIQNTELNYSIGYLTEIEKVQQYIDEWYRTSEVLKNNVIKFFQAIDIVNPIYMMAFSGARGNISQVRQLIGMRGLMSDPQGQILDFPIRSNFREGLTLTEYLISCYGARKGIVDTALRTATSGYLTRRLVDVTQHVIIGQKDCKTDRTISLTSLIDNNEIVLSLKNRLVGRILGENIRAKDKKSYLGLKNHEINSNLAFKISQLRVHVQVRSPLTCLSESAVCQFCYGWNLARNALVSLGDSVGILAAQSIGEPGTQLTMRTFHTGGVFTGKVFDQVYAPFQGKIHYLGISHGRLVRTLQGRIAFLAKTPERLQISQIKKIKSKSLVANLLWSSQFKKRVVKSNININLNDSIQNLQKIEKKVYKDLSQYNSRLIFNFPTHTLLFTKHGSRVLKKQLIAEFSQQAPKKEPDLESEYDIQSTTSGQVYFENLMLIEKSKFSDAFPKTAYLLGSLLILEGIIFKGIPLTQPFVRTGDIINNSSIFQKIQILIPSLYFYDLTSFLTRTRSSLNEDKKSMLSNQNYLIFKRFIMNFKFQKIYYKKFQYFGISKNKPSTNFIIANFKFSISKSKKIVYKHKKKIYTSFQLKYFLSTNLTIDKSFPLQFLISYIPYSQNLKFVYSGKVINQNSNQLYRFWIFFTEKYFLQFCIHSVLVQLYWQNYNKEYFYSLYLAIEFPKTLKIKFLKKSKIFKNIRNNISKVKNSKNVLFKKNEKAFRVKKFLRFFAISGLSSPLRFIIKKNSHYLGFSIIRLNRQGEQLVYFTKSLPYLNSKNRIYYRNSSNILKEFNQVVYNRFFIAISYCRKKYFQNTQLKSKPIIFHFDQNHLFIKVKKQNSLFLFLKKFLQFNFYPFPRSFGLSQSNRYLFIGFKSQFRILSFPKFNFIINYKPILQYLKNKKIRFLKASKEKFFTTIKRKFQLSSDWLYLTKLKKFSGYVENQTCYGSVLYDGIIFDNQFTCIDLSPKTFFNCQKLIKFYFNKNKKYSCLVNKNKRFLFYNLKFSTFICFYKIKISFQYDFLQYISMNQTENSTFLQSLRLNQILTFSNSFKLHSFVPVKLKFQLRSYSKINILSKKTKFSKHSRFYESKFALSLQRKKLPSRPFFSCKLFNPIFKSTQKSLYFDNWVKRSSIEFQYVQVKKKFFSQIELVLNNQFITFDTFLNDKATNVKIYYQITNSVLTRSQIIIHFFRDNNISEILNHKEQQNCILLNKFNLAIYPYVNCPSILKVGHFIRSNTVLASNCYLQTGQIIYIDQSKIIFRKAFSMLVPTRGILNVSHDQLISKNTRLFTFLYKKMKTGDIIQGIPKVEEFLEARSTREGYPVFRNLHWLLKDRFQFYKKKYSRIQAAKKSFEEIQYIIMDEVQKIYCSQGVNIADKHLEIVIRQMISKVQILESGQFGLLSGELIPLRWIEYINKKYKYWRFTYKPILLGITRACLETDSFISAASFQETTRILTKASIQSRIDFIRGLKPNVILGNLIPAGTGFFPFID